MSRISDWCNMNGIPMQAFVDWQIALDRHEVYEYVGNKDTAGIEFQLEDTEALNMIADTIRKESGYKPLFDDDGDGIDEFGWYFFYVYVSAVKPHITGIQCLIVNSSSEDNDRIFDIPITKKESALIYAEINKQCKELYGVDCERLFKEDREFNEAKWSEEEV